MRCATLPVSRTAATDNQVGRRASGPDGGAVTLSCSCLALSGQTPVQTLQSTRTAASG